MTRLVLFGGGGQLGTALRPRLAHEFEVFAPDRSICDLTNPDAIKTYLADVHPEVIVNAAAYTQVDQAETERDVAFAINAKAVETMAQCAKKIDALLLTYSTDYVFDGMADEPYGEHESTHPISVYGHSKSAGEEAVRLSGCRYLIVRTAWLYSAHGRNFLKTILRLAQDRDELTVVDDQIGSPTSAEWLADATGDLLAQAVNGETRQTVHAVCAGRTSWHGFASAILEQAKSRGFALSCQSVRAISSAQYPTAAPRPAFSVLDTAKLQTDWKITPPPWKEALIAVMDTLQPDGTS